MIVFVTRIHTHNYVEKYARVADWIDNQTRQAKGFSGVLERSAFCARCLMKGGNASSRKDTSGF